MSQDVQISKFMSLVLRHSPSDAGLILDENGWVDFDTLYQALASRFHVSRDDVLRIVETNPKKRFTLADGRIRAAQGHSVDVDLALAPIGPPQTLYHGTKHDVLAAILAEGLTKQSRQHVHLSKDIETAKIVAKRRKGIDVILIVDSGRMSKDGETFYLSENGVWLTNHVPPKYLRQLTEQEQE